jgi:hypothetical protein
VNAAAVSKKMNVVYVMAPVKQMNVDVKVSRMEPVTVMVMYWMNVANVADLAYQMVSVTVMVM